MYLKIDYELFRGCALFLSPEYHPNTPPKTVFVAIISPNINVIYMSKQNSFDDFFPIQSVSVENCDLPLFPVLVKYFCYWENLVTLDMFYNFSKFLDHSSNSSKTRLGEQFIQNFKKHTNHLTYGSLRTMPCHQGNLVCIAIFFK